MTLIEKYRCSCDRELTEGFPIVGFGIEIEETDDVGR